MLILAKMILIRPKTLNSQMIKGALVFLSVMFNFHANPQSKA